MAILNNAGFHYNDMNVCTLDVGQADARVLTTPQDTGVLFDADQDRITDSLNDETIDQVLITHLHDDHVAGLRHLADKGYTLQQAHQPSVARYDIENGDVKPDIQKGYITNLSSLGIDIDNVYQLIMGDKSSMRKSHR